MDEPVEPGSGGRYGPEHESRLSRVETEVRDMKETQAGLTSSLARVEAKLDAGLAAVGAKIDTLSARFDAILPHLATKADLAATQSDITRLQVTLDATLPHLATRVDLAEKPSKTYMWGILAALLTAYACGLAALAMLK
jgi:hypothetical protein